MARIRKFADSAGCPESCGRKWLVAAYIRLSREDGNDESLSVTNQKKIIREYLETCFDDEYTLVDYYIDDADIIGLNQKNLKSAGVRSYSRRLTVLALRFPKRKSISIIRQSVWSMNKPAG